MLFQFQFYLNTRFKVWFLIPINSVLLSLFARNWSALLAWKHKNWSMPVWWIALNQNLRERLTMGHNWKGRGPKTAAQCSKLNNNQLHWNCQNPSFFLVKNTFHSTASGICSLFLLQLQPCWPWMEWTVSYHQAERGFTALSSTMTKARGDRSRKWISQFFCLMLQLFLHSGLFTLWGQFWVFTTTPPPKVDSGWKGWDLHSYVCITKLKIIWNIVTFTQGQWSWQVKPVSMSNALFMLFRQFLRNSSQLHNVSRVVDFHHVFDLWWSWRR